MIEKNDRLDLRCKPMFKEGVKKLAEKERTEVSELVRRAVKEHNDNVYGTIKLLKIMGVPS